MHGLLRCEEGLDVSSRQYCLLTLTWIHVAFVHVLQFLFLL
jgi:hypothetical protein